MDEQITSRSILNIRNLAILAVFGLMIWFIVITRQILGIFLFSMVLAFLLYPPVEWFYRRKFPRSIAILVVYLLVFIIIGLILLLILPPLINQFQNLINYLAGSGPSSLFAKLQFQLAHFENNFNKQFGTDIKIQELVVENQEKIQGFIVSILNWAAMHVGNIASFITLIVSIPVITFYLLMDWPKIKISLMKFLPPNVKESTANLMIHLTDTLNSYLRGQIKLSFLMAVIVTATLALFNGIGSAIPSYGFHIGPYLILGLLSGMTEVIPIVGPIIAFTPALILGFMDGTATGITVILLYALIQFCEGNILVPRIMGEKLDVHPLTVMFSLLCGGLLGGIGGMLLALPVAAALKVIFEQYYQTFIQRVESLILEQSMENNPENQTRRTDKESLK